MPIHCGFQKGHKALRTKEQYKLADKSFFNNPEYKEKMKQIAISHGYGKWMKDKKRSNETIEKISKANTGRRKINPLTPEYKRIRTSKSWIKWREAVFIRDNFTCRKCGIKNSKGYGKTIELNPHHIKSFKEHPGLAFDIRNGVTLCRECHKKTDSWGHHS